MLGSPRSVIRAMIPGPSGREPSLSFARVIFGGLLVPFLGFLFLPWNSLAYVAVWTVGGLSPIGWLIVVLAFLVDIGSFGGGAYRNRDRARRYRE